MVGRFPVQARNTEPIFGEQVISFLQTFPRPLIQTPGFSIMDPYRQPAVAEITRQFYIRFYPDDRQRLFLFGRQSGQVWRRGDRDPLHRSLGVA